MISSTYKPVHESSLQVYDVGEGAKVGYLHGPLGNPSCHEFLNALAADHQVVAPCLPGFNGSAVAHTNKLHDWVFETSAALDTASLTGSSVVAASIGAMLALEVAAIRPEAFKQLILIAPFGLWDTQHPIYDLWSERGKRQPDRLLVDPGKAGDFFVDGPDLGADEKMDSELQRYRTRTSAASLMWQIPEHGLARRLHRVTCPVHLIWGDQDQIVDPSYFERFHEALPDSTGPDMVEGAGHLAEWDAPEAVADIVRAALIRP